MLLLDSDILIDVQRGFPPAVARLRGLVERPSVPGFVVMELVQSSRDAGEVRAAMRLVRALPVVWPRASDCDTAALIYTRAHLSHGLGLIDALIGATAVGLSGELCTFNVKHFRAIPGLRTLQPYLKP